MKTKHKFYLVLLSAFFIACDNDDDSVITDPVSPVEFSYDFDSGAEGWTGDFADYPQGEEESFELQFEHTTLPEPLDQSEGALMLSGTNNSDDLFMFIKREVTGLTPNQQYTIDFEIEFASNVADDTPGIGGSPGESVYVKAGAAPIEPITVLDEDGDYRMNIDKSNQSQSGEDMIVIGDFSNDTDQDVYTLKTVTNTEPFQATTDNNGSLWLIVGTDSGFMGTTTIFYNRIHVELQ